MSLLSLNVFQSTRISKTVWTWYPAFVWKYTKTSKSILRPALGQSDLKTAGPAPTLIKWHIINFIYCTNKLFLFSRFSLRLWYGIKMCCDDDIDRVTITLPGDFATNVTQINQPTRFNFDVKLCRPILPHNQILCLHAFLNLRSLYFQSLQSLPNWTQLHTLETSPVCTSFQWVNNKHAIASIRTVPAQVIHSAVERAARTLHRMSPCTPVSVPAKITWYWKRCFNLITSQMVFSCFSDLWDSQHLSAAHSLWNLLKEKVMICWLMAESFNSPHFYKYSYFQSIDWVTAAYF